MKSTNVLIKKKPIVSFKSLAPSILIVSGVQIAFHRAIVITKYSK